MSRRFEPEGLPRQRRGTTPGMVGRYPDFDVLESAGHWDEVTRRVVLARLEPPPRRFFDEVEWADLDLLCDHLSGQAGEEPRIPVLAFVDEKLHAGRGEGYRYEDMPDDGTTWRTVARGVAGFAEWTLDQRDELCHRFSRGEPAGGPWEELNVKRAFGVVMRDVCAAYYSHPWAWNEIGFPGPAYPRGYSRFGSPHLRDGETETWEAVEAFELDPVRDVKERGLD